MTLGRRLLLPLPHLLRVSAHSSAAMASHAASNSAAGQGDANNYLIVDIGANLTNKKFARDLDNVIQRAKEAGKDRSRKG